MKYKPYSHPRWWDNPMPIDSLCNFCAFHRIFQECDKYPDGIPNEIFNKSFPTFYRPAIDPESKRFDENYCEYRVYSDSLTKQKIEKIEERIKEVREPL